MPALRRSAPLVDGTGNPDFRVFRRSGDAFASESASQMPPDSDTPRIRLLPLTTGDLDAICSLLWLPEVRHHLFDDSLVPREVVAGIIRDSADPSSITAFWRIATAADDVIGLIGLRPPATTFLALRAIGWRSLELVVALDPRFWGRGLASQAVAAVAEHAGRDGVTFALVAGVDEGNLRSHALMRRCRFHELGGVAGPDRPLVVYERAV